MGICNDDATTYLRRLGYNVVRHPREGIAPLDLIGVQGGETRYLGGLGQLLVAAGKLPEIKRDEVAADVQGKSSSKLSAAIGVSLLKTVTAALGGNVGVNSGYHRAKTLQFVFTKVLSDSVKPLEIGDFLRAGEVDVGNLLLEQYVLGNGRLYVISRVIKTNHFTIQAERGSGTAAELDVPAVKGVASGSLKIDVSAAATGVVSYDGDKQLVFGFECFEVGVVDGVLSLTSARSGSVALATGEAAAVPAAMLGDGNLVSLSE